MTLVARLGWRRWIVAAAGVALAGCTGDEFTSSGGGEGGGTTTSTTGPVGPGSSASGPSSSSGGPGGSSSVSAGPGASSSSGTGGGETCDAGCVDDQGCHTPPDRDHCGPLGGACMACAPPEEECLTATCTEDGDCLDVAVPDGMGCMAGLGACVDGECVIGTEICDNDVDDADVDLDVDCVDSECGDFSCSGQAPESGFAGPFLVLVGPTASDCPSREPLVTYFGNPQGACECGPPSGTGCTAYVDSHGSTSCVDGGLVREVGEACANTSPSVSVAVVDTTGTCAASGAVRDGAVSTYTVCEIPEGGCERRAVCAPPLEDVSNTTPLLCIGAPGAGHQCPDPWQLVRPVRNDSELTCDCSCALGEDGCSGTVQTYSDDACLDCASGACTAFDAPREGPCLLIANQPLSWALVDVTYEGMIPDPGPVELGGEAFTLCCTPYPSPR